jgi:hypothetical protein
MLFVPGRDKPRAPGFAFALEVHRAFWLRSLIANQTGKKVVGDVTGYSCSVISANLIAV